MIHTIRVKTSRGPDIQGEGVLHDIRSVLKINSIQKVETASVYRLEGISKLQAKKLAEILFCEKINQAYSLNKPFAKKSSTVFEVGYKPGVMNPQVTSIIKSARDLGINITTADTSIEYEFHGQAKKQEVKEILEKLHLLNDTIQHIVMEEPKTLLTKGTAGKTTIIPIRKMNNSELLALSKDKLFLNLDELHIVKKYFVKIKRNPTDCELETIAQAWSEHCVHKTFKANLIIDGKKKKPLIQRIKEEALKHNKNIVSAFVDNSGVMDFYDGFAICGKVETHNSPSAIEPYGGAMTGSGGVFRDVLGTGLGAKCIASTDIFCFAHPNMNPSLLPNGCLPPDYLLKRVVAGVRDYGNRVGIPTNNGSVHFHNDFRAKPTVVVGAYGILPKKKAKKGRPKIGDVIVCVGGKTGRDGIHGATFSSGEMTEKTSSINSSAVQIGNAIEEKRMFDAILEAQRQNCIRAIQDCGAGGFSSAIGEIGQSQGVSVYLDKVSLKYKGLAPWEIWVSESQERMILAIPFKNLKQFLNICKLFNVQASILGKFDGSKKLQVYFRKKSVCNLDMKFLHHGLPQRIMRAKKNTSDEPIQSPRRWPDGLLRGKLISENEWIEVLERVLSHGNIASKEQIARLYDHSVGGTNDLQSYSGEELDSPNDAVVIRPILNKEFGMVISHGLNPVLNAIDPYWGSIWASAEALANYTAVGGDYKNASLINNYIWPFPDEESLWSLDKSVDAVVDIMKKLKIPVISGKDSLSSTYRGKDGAVIKIPPVLCMSVFGKIPNTSKTITSDFKKENSSFVLVGKMDFSRMGGSIYYETQEIRHGEVPHVDLEILPKTLTRIYRGIVQGKILSCHDISEGGLITALFEMCIGGGMGATIHLRGGRMDSSEVNHPEAFLFNETAGCFIVEVEHESTAKNLFTDVPFLMLGKTTKEKLITVQRNNRKMFSADVALLKKVWQEPMKKLFP